MDKHKFEKEKTRLLFELNNNPRGIPHSKLPTEPELIGFLKSLIKQKKAVWLQELDGTWLYIKMKEGTTAPMGKTTFRWLPPELNKKRSKHEKAG